MIFFSRGSHDKGRGRGKNNFWQRGNKRLRFSIYFDVDPQELNHLFQVSFFNLVGQGVFQSHPRPERPPYQPRSRLSNVHVPIHVPLQPEVVINDGWKDIVHQPIFHQDGCPTICLPFLPLPPLNQHAQYISHIASPFQSSHTSKRFKTTIPELKSSKDKKVVTHSKSSNDSSHSVTSHARQTDEHSRAFSEVHPQASNQPHFEKANSTNKAENATSSEKKQTTSHSKYGF
jgi:hypothetical protein